MRFEQINYLTDTVMPVTKPNTFKVIMAVARRTWGWGRDCEQISFTEFQDATGISSRSTIDNAIQNAIDEGYIDRNEEGQSYCYRMTTSPENVPALVQKSYQTSPEIVPIESDNQSRNRTSTSPKTVPDQSRNRTSTSPKTVPVTSGLKQMETKEKQQETSDFVVVVSAYENEIGLLTPAISEFLNDAFDEFGGEKVVQAIQIAAKQNARRWSYIDGILKNWRVNGYQSPQARQANGVMVDKLWQQILAERGRQGRPHLDDSTLSIIHDIGGWNNFTTANPFQLKDLEKAFRSKYEQRQTTAPA